MKNKKSTKVKHVVELTGLDVIAQVPDTKPTGFQYKKSAIAANRGSINDHLFFSNYFFKINLYIRVSIIKSGITSSCTTAANIKHRHRN